MILSVPAIPMKTCYLNEQRLFTLRFKNLFYVVKDACFHRGGPLSKGAYDEKTGVIICPMHQLKSCARNIVKEALPVVQTGNMLRIVVRKQT